ncbi:HAD family hydrolase [Campylobacter sp. MG1]|uniref:HAD family hydrolase n=1 Tax=Campylobacter sp. MG1 TaxID=2976332 RepID=UPI00226C7365|nr:HAD family hydrolase [Campylobacter sp. MG1]
MIIFFDLDGTLIDSTKPIVSSLKLALKDIKINLDDNEIKKLIGKSLEEMFATMGVKNEQIKEVVRLYRQYYKDIYKIHTTLLPQAKEAVELAHKFAKVGLVTTKAHIFAKEILNDFHILNYFDVIVGGDEVKKCKPNPEPIFKALSILANKETTLSKECLQEIFEFDKVYMIGDTLNDTQAAKNAGVKALVTLFEYADLSNFDNENDIIFNTPLECVEYIIKNNK